MVLNKGMTSTKKFLLPLAVAAAGILPAATHTTNVVEAMTVTTICKDSNGAAPGGSVYLDYRIHTFICDVRPPQRLHLTHTPSLAACNQAGGNYSPATHICWDVDY
jgi:hypothetical protein